MYTKGLAAIFTALLTANAVYAQDCLPDLSRALPDVSVPELNLHVNTNTVFCFDPSSEKNEEIIKKFYALKDKSVFDDNNCLLDKKFDPETSVAITQLIAQTTKGRLNVYAADANNPSESAPLLMTNSTDKNFVNKAMTTSQLKIDESNELTTKDAVEIGGAAVIGSLVGTIAERQAFKNSDGSLQHDKLLHSNYGAMINIGSVGAAYLAIETSGLGDKLNMTKNQKKWAILLAGTVMGLLVGYGKERFYDYYHQDIHTYDPHFKGDMGATWLGGGALNFIGGAITFKF